MEYTTTGSDNTAIGFHAFSHDNDIALGHEAGSRLTAGGHDIDIDNRGVAGKANTIRIGKQGPIWQPFVAGTSGATVAGGVEVIVDSKGHLGTDVPRSVSRIKMKPMGKASEAILSLQPVTCRYKQELDSDSIPQFGIVAGQVEKVNPDLVARDDKGKA